MRRARLRECDAAWSECVALLTELWLWRLLRGVLAGPPAEPDPAGRLAPQLLDAAGGEAIGDLMGSFAVRTGLLALPAFRVGVLLPVEGDCGIFARGSWGRTEFGVSVGGRTFG
jgi:hypothetical protein